MDRKFKLDDSFKVAMEENRPQDSAIDTLLTNAPNSVYFRLADDGEVVLKISKEGFYYRGELVEDIHNVYERFTEWLTKAELKDRQVSPQEDKDKEWLLPRAFKKESGEHIPNGYNVYIKEKEIEKISEDEARIREILNDPSSIFVGYSQEGYNLHIWINQGKKYYIEPELNRINRIEY